MSAWLQQGSPFGNYYLRTDAAGIRTFRNLRTNDPETAQAALVDARAEIAQRPVASGNIRWRKAEWQQFAGMPGKTRVSKQGYACAARAVDVLKGPRWHWLTK